MLLHTCIGQIINMIKGESWVISLIKQRLELDMEIVVAYWWAWLIIIALVALVYWGNKL